MAAFVIPAVMGAISLAQTIGGAVSARKARKEFENRERLDYTDTDAFRTAETSENMAGRWAQEGIPESAFRFQEDMISRSGAAALSGAQGLRQGVSGLSATAYGLADQYRSLAAMDAQQQLANRQDWMRQRDNLQNQQRYAFDIEMDDYTLDQAAVLGRMSAGRDTMNAGLSGISTGLATAVDMGLLGNLKR